MTKLNLPSYPFRVRTLGQSKEIFDLLRKKFVSLTPEEWVRQHFIMFLKEQLHYPAGYMTVEKGLTVNTRAKRTDIVIHNPEGQPWMIVECKSPQIRLSEDTFYQAATYHLQLNVRFLVITNGIQHYCCKLADGNFEFVKGFPAYNE